MRTNILFTLLLLGVYMTSCADNFQKRLIYMMGDTVCHQGSAMNDMIKLKINVDGLETRTRYAWGFTTCADNQINTKLGGISWPEEWNYYDFDTDTNILFNEQIQGAAFYQLLYLDLKTTVNYPSRVDGKPYNCTIIGDGHMQHYGQEHSEQFSPCEYYVKCDKIVKEEQH